jgi:5-hydroxyisourate hydrolase-like protein (transthyretin family)
MEKICLISRRLRRACCLSVEALFLILFVAGCATTQTPVPGGMIPLGVTDWIITDPPVPSPRVTYPDPTTGQDVTKAWVQLTNQQIMNLLSNTHSEISVAKRNGDGTLTYLAAQATAAVGTYRVVMDYTNYTTEDAVDSETHSKIGMARVGVGLRLTANITTNKANINLGSLLALGIAANLNQVYGAMTVDSIGIRIAGAGGPILSSATIDESSIQKTLESMAVIQSKVADTTTHLDPQVLWVKPFSSSVKPPQIVNSIK